MLRYPRFGYSEKAAVVSAAIRERDLSRVAKLLTETPELAGVTDETGNAPIHWAVLTRQLVLIPELVQLGADIDHTRFDGSRPIDLVDGDYWFNHSGYAHAAPVRESADVIEELLTLGAAYGLCVAIRLGDTEQVLRIMEKWPEKVNELSNSPGARSTAGATVGGDPLLSLRNMGGMKLQRT